MEKNQKIILSALAIIAISLVGYYIMQKNSGDAEIINPNQYQEAYVQNAIKKEETNEILVHVAGEVKDEGVVILKENSRVKDAIEEAGGLLSTANLNSINLAEKVKDGQKIYIPSIYDEEVEDSDINMQNQDKQNKKININTATASDLETLTGIGPSTAQKIINYRKENGEFLSIEDIMEVPGIGEAKFESIKEEIEV